MIFESAPWRSDLLRDAAVLERWLGKPVGERRSVIIEKKMFVGAYAMRRLLQSGKLSTSTESKNVSVDRFPSIKNMEKHNRWFIDEHYDFAKGEPANLTIPRLLDLLIHSFVFQEWFDESERETKIVFTSDRTRNQYLWLIRTSAFVTLMRFVADDNPAVYTRHFDAERNRWVEWRGVGNPPGWPDFAARSRPATTQSASTEEEAVGETKN